MNTTDPDKTGAYVPASDTSVVPEEPAVADPTVPAGERFGAFVLTGEPRRDGDVTRTDAWQVGLSRAVVVTRLAPDAAPEAAAGLKREAAVAAKFAHPGVLPVVEAGEKDGQPYLVVVSPDGETLAERMARGKIPERVVARWAAQIVETLFHAHEAGVVHGNLRPEFIHLGLDGRVRISGFGSAPPGEDDEYQPQRWRTSAIAKPSDDAYAVGVMLWTAATGKPLDGKSRLVSRDFREICERTLRHGYGYGQRRPMVPLLTDLRRFLAHKPLRYQDGFSVNAARRWVRRNQRAVAWAGLVVLAVGAGRVTDEYRKEAAWEALFANESPNEAAAAEFAALARRHGGDNEITAGLFYAEGRFDAAKTVFFGREYRRVGDKPDPDRLTSQINARLNRETVSDEFAGRPDRVAEAIRAGGAEALSRLDDPAAAKARAELAIRAADRFLGVPAVRTALMERYFDHGGISLEVKIPDWQRSPEARDVLPALIVSVPTSNGSDDGRKTAEQTLERIDPQWPKNPASRRAIPALAVQSISGDSSDRGWAAAMLTRIDPDWARRPEARAAIPRVIAWLAGRDRSPGDADKNTTAAFTVLQAIDPQWRTSAEARQGAGDLVRVIERYPPEMYAAYNPYKGGFATPSPAGERTLHRTNLYADARRAIAVLARLGPAAAEAKRLEAWLGHPDDVYRGLIAAAVSLAAPGWAETPAGAAAVSDLRALAKDANPETAKIAAWALSRITSSASNP